jgi:hypothetical protein
MQVQSYYKILKNATLGLSQQMIMWGHDVKHPHGNALQRFGMQRDPSAILKGTSSYSMPWENGQVLLHGALAAWHSNDATEQPGIIYCRKLKRMSLWSEDRHPVPGIDTGKYASDQIRWEACQPLLRWLINYETWVVENLGRPWRMKTWQAQKSLLINNPWLRPTEALEWWKEHVEQPSMH